MFRSKPKQERKFSAVSKADDLRWREADVRIRVNRRQLEEAQEGLRHAKKNLESAGRRGDDSQLDDQLNNVERLERRIAYLEGKSKEYEREKVELEAAIEARKSGREKCCHLLADLAAKRLERLRAAVGHLETARDLLGQGYAELTAQMEGCAAEIELKRSFDDGISGIAAEMPSLTALNTAEAWAARFLNGYGQELPGLMAYGVVAEEPVDLGETLCHTGLIPAGGIVWLTPSEAENVNRRPAIKRKVSEGNFVMEPGIRLLPLEEFREVEARAKVTNCSLNLALHLIEGDKAAMKRAQAARPPSQEAQAHAHFAALRGQDGGRQ